MLKDDSLEARKAAVAALGKIGVAALPALAAGLKETDPNSRFLSQTRWRDLGRRRTRRSWRRSRTPVQRSA